MKSDNSDANEHNMLSTWAGLDQSESLQIVSYMERDDLREECERAIALLQAGMRTHLIGVHGACIAVH